MPASPSLVRQQPFGPNGCCRTSGQERTYREDRRRPWPSAAPYRPPGEPRSDRTPVHVAPPESRARLKCPEERMVGLLIMRKRARPRRIIRVCRPAAGQAHHKGDRAATHGPAALTASRKRLHFGSVMRWLQACCHVSARGSARRFPPRRSGRSGLRAPHPIERGPARPLRGPAADDLLTRSNAMPVRDWSNACSMTCYPMAVYHGTESAEWHPPVLTADITRID